MSHSVGDGNPKVYILREGMIRYMGTGIRVLNCLSDPRLGGPQRRAMIIAKRLNETTSIKTEFLLPKGPRKFTTQLRDNGFVVHTPGIDRLHPPRHLWKNVSYLGRFPSSVYKIYEIIKNGDFDVIHINSPTNLYSSIAGRLSSAKVAWHMNGYNFPQILLEIVRSIAPVTADEIVFSSSIVREHIFGDNINGKIIFPPVDTERFDPENIELEDGLKNELNIDKSKPVVGTVGNINPAKDYERLLYAVRRVIDRYGEITVPIIGGMSETKKHYVNQIIELRDSLELEENVHFLGWRSNIPRLLTEFDLFTLSSKSETGPMSLIEAMAMKLPAVTTRVGVARDVSCIEDVAFVVPPNSTERLTTGIIAALESRHQWNKYGEEARQCVEEWFSLTRSVSKHRELYNAMVDNE